MNPLFRLAFLMITVIFAASCNITGNKIHPDCLIETGIASWYGSDYHGTTTANGETYNMNSLTAAHKTLPFNTVVHVVNLDNGKNVTVRINNRGPFVEGRVIDLSREAARKIDIITAGLADVELHLVQEGDSPLPDDMMCG